MENVLITGSSSGFGYMSAVSLARKGYKVWASMRQPNGKNASKQQELQQLAEAEGLQISVIEMDVTQDESVAHAVKHIIETDGRIDNLVNNAGVMYVGITEAYSIDQAKSQFETNFFGILRTVKAVTPHMRKAGKGFILNITSLAGRLTFPYFGIYCASKHAVESYSQALRYELAPFGVEVSIIEPGPFDTGLLYSGPAEADQQVFEAYGEHREVPKAVLKNFEGFYESADALDPQIVADDIVRMIETQKGQRNARIVSGIDYGTVQYNTLVEPIQEALVRDALQMGHLLEVSQN